MRWFASFWLTLLLTGIVAGLLWLRTHPLFGIRETTQVLQWLIPEAVVMAMHTFLIPILFATMFVIRAILQRVLAYTASAIDAAPRAQPGKRARLGSLAFTLWHNPTRWWLSPYVTLLTIVVAITGFFVLVFDRSLEARLAWGLTALFASTVVASMAMPDRRQRMRILPTTDPDEAVDPVLAIPGLPAPPASP